MNRISGALDAFGAVTGATSLASWNDDRTRTREHVLAALDAALVRVSSGRGLNRDDVRRRQRLLHEVNGAIADISTG